MEHVAAVYRLFDVADQLLYVGVAKYFGSRWKRHAKDQPWWGRVHHQAVTWYDNRDDALEAELQAIIKEGPLFNKQGSPWELVEDEVTGFYVVLKASHPQVKTTYRYRKATAREHAIELAGLLRAGDIPDDPMLGKVLRGLTEVIHGHLAGTLVLDETDTLESWDFGQPHPSKVRLGEILARRGAQGASVRQLWSVLGAEGRVIHRGTLHRWLSEYEQEGRVVRPAQPHHPQGRWVWNVQASAA